MLGIRAERHEKLAALELLHLGTKIEHLIMAHPVFSYLCSLPV